MRRLKILTTAIAATAALTAIAATTATAALPEFEPGAKGETFTGTSGTGTLETSKKGIVSVCAADKIKGLLLSKAEVLITIDFETCKVFGIIFSSLGDKENIVLFHFTAKLCYINKEKKEVGLLGSILPLHLESGDLLLIVLGSLIGALTPVNTKTKEFEIKYEQEKSVQKIKKCEGGPENLLFTSENEGAFELSGLGTTEKFTFTNAQELLA